MPPYRILLEVWESQRGPFMWHFSCWQHCMVAGNGSIKYACFQRCVLFTHSWINCKALVSDSRICGGHRSRSMRREWGGRGKKLGPDASWNHYTPNYTRQKVLVSASHFDDAWWILCRPQALTSNHWSYNQLGMGRLSLGAPYLPLYIYSCTGGRRL